MIKGLRLLVVSLNLTEFFKFQIMIARPMTLMASPPVTRTRSLEALRVRVTGRLTRRDLARARKTPARVTIMMAVRDHGSDRHGPSHGHSSLQSHWHSLAGWPESRLCVTVTPARSAAALSPVRDSDRDVPVTRTPPGRG